MRIAICPADLTGCGTYRMIYPAQAVQTVRPDWQITLYKPSEVKVGMRNGKAVAVQGINPHEIDLLVMQRIGMPGPLAFLRWAQDNGIATVLDSDDAMHCIEKENVAYRAWNSVGLHWRYLDEAARHADLVTVTTEALAQHYAKHGRAEVLPNRVPAAVAELPSERDQHPEQLAVGWAGFTATHPRDLNVVGGAVRDALDATNAAFRVIGSAKGVDEALQLPDGTVEDLGSRPLGVEYYSALSSIDVAIVPLADNKFNKSKSSLKALEFSAMGVPVVASATPANVELAKSVPILLATSTNQWEEHLQRLLTDSSERVDRGAAAREAVRAGWTIETGAELWAQAWERAANRRAAMS